MPFLPEKRPIQPHTPKNPVIFAGFYRQQAKKSPQAIARSQAF